MPRQDALARIEDRDEDAGNICAELDETRAANEVAKDDEDDENGKDETEEEVAEDEELDKGKVGKMMCVSLSLFAGPCKDEGLFEFAWTRSRHKTQCVCRSCALRKRTAVSSTSCAVTAFSSGSEREGRRDLA